MKSDYSCAEPQRHIGHNRGTHSLCETMFLLILSRIRHGTRCGWICRIKHCLGIRFIPGFELFNYLAPPNWI